jgi:hypothetical protein
VQRQKANLCNQLPVADAEDGAALLVHRPNQETPQAEVVVQQRQGAERPGVSAAEQVDRAEPPMYCSTPSTRTATA